MFEALPFPVFGLTGLAGAGKSSVADILVREHGFKRISFAEPLKEMVATLDPFLDRDGTRLSTVIADAKANNIDPQKTLKDWYPEYRRILQVLGTDCIRRHDPTFWIEIAASRIRKAAKVQPVVVDDVRFPNEAEVILDFLPDKEPNDSSSVRLWNVLAYKGDRTVGHASERWQGRMGEGVEVLNEGSLDDLEMTVSGLYYDYLTGDL